jgi:hypothetical protein
MASLFDVSLGPSEPTDQKISEALLGTGEIPRRVHRPQQVILRDLPIEGGDQACETFRANHGINFEFLHVLLSPYLLGSRHRQKGLGHLLASVSLPDAVPSIFNQPSAPGTERMSSPSLPVPPRFRSRVILQRFILIWRSVSPKSRKACDFVRLG